MHAWQEFGMLYIELIPESIVFQFVFNPHTSTSLPSHFSHLQTLSPSSSHSILESLNLRTHVPIHLAVNLS